MYLNPRSHDVLAHIRLFSVFTLIHCNKRTPEKNTESCFSPISLHEAQFNTILKILRRMSQNAIIDIIIIPPIIIIDRDGMAQYQNLCGDYILMEF